MSTVFKIATNIVSRNQWILTFGILFSAHSLVFSQRDTITILHDYTPQKGLQLKWLPNDDVTFLEGFKNGYNLYRAEVKKVNGGEQLGTFAKLNEEVIRYWSVDRLKNELAKDSALSIATLYIEGANELINREVKSTPAEAVEQKEADQMLHLLGVFAAVNNNKVAQALGMYFVDEQVVIGQKYVYKLEVEGTTEYTSYLMIVSLGETEKPKVLQLTASLEPKAVHLKWYNNQNLDFPYFNIYRSTKENGDYTKLNKLPYVGDQGSANFDGEYTSYIDSIPAYEKTYFYKVIGVNAFENEGAPSELATVYTAYLLENAPVIYDSKNDDGSDISLSWAIDPQDANYIEGFHVFRAQRGSGPYKKITKKRLSKTTNTFLDDTPKGSSNYYVVSAYGESGDSVNSILHSHLLLDSIPPSQPVIISGICDTNGVVTLAWELNNEQDLRGYRIFKTYDLEQDPKRVFPYDTLATEISDSVDLKMPYNSIYYRLFALDQHFNPSIPSSYFEVHLPDLNPPSNGFLKDYTVGMNGISLEWEKSSAADLAKMYLLRKSDEDFQYHTILTLQGDSLSLSQYTDTTTKAFVNYEYALLSEDEAGLQSERSDPFLIQQLNKKKVASIQNLRAIVSRESEMIKLSWGFNVPAEGFRVYRSENNGPLKTYTFIDGREREFYDKRLNPNTQYTYLMVAELKGGYKSGFSKKIEVKY